MMDGQGLKLIEPLRELFKCAHSLTFRLETAS